jgi:hypothetical protein
VRGFRHSGSGCASFSKLDSVAAEPEEGTGVNAGAGTGAAATGRERVKEGAGFAVEARGCANGWISRGAFGGSASFAMGVTSGAAATGVTSIDAGVAAVDVGFADGGETRLLPLKRRPTPFSEASDWLLFSPEPRRLPSPLPSTGFDIEARRLWPVSLSRNVKEAQNDNFLSTRN